MHEAEPHQPTGISHEKCACSGVVFFCGTAGIVEIVYGCQCLKVRFVHISRLHLLTDAGKGECRIPEHREIIPVRLLVPEEVDRDHLPVYENGQSVAAFCGITIRGSALNLCHPVLKKLSVLLLTPSHARLAYT